MIKPKNLLIVRIDRIGDVILSIPMAEAIKKAYPNCKITFLVREYTKDLLYNNPFIDNVIIAQEEQSELLFEKNLNLLKTENFDTAIAVYPTFKLALLLFAAKIKNRIGTGYRWYSFFFNKKVYEHRKYGTKHELMLNLNMLEQIGIQNNFEEKDIHFNISVNEVSNKRVDEFLSSKNVDTSLPIILVHPGSRGSAIDYPIDKMKNLLKLISNELSANILLTGSNDEIELCKTLEIKDSTINAAGKFNLSELTALINRSDIMIANSTGPIHIAAALGKYVIGFYPKIPASSKTRWGPFTSKKRIFEPTIDCSNCTRKQCEELNCMSSIDERSVLESVKECLRKILN